MSLMMYAISFESKVLNNKITKYISNVSMEVYLCHMVMFRIVEKIHIGRYISNDYICYTITFILVFTLSIIFARVFQIAYAKISEKYKTSKNKSIKEQMWNKTSSCGFRIRVRRYY